MQSKRRQEAAVVGLEVDGWRTKARETAERLMAQEVEVAMRQAAKARCGELGAQCEARHKDIEAAVEAHMIVQAQAEFPRVYSETQARCKAESEAAVETRIDEAKAELRLESERARAEFEARYKAEAGACIAEVGIDASAEAMNNLEKAVIADHEKAVVAGGFRRKRKLMLRWFPGILDWFQH